MAERPRLEFAAAAVALLVCAAFLASFALGLGGGRSSGGDATTMSDAPAAAGRVEVLNASRRSGLARAATDRLRAAGFDVVYYGNAPASAGDSSLVLGRTGRDAVARAAAELLGIRRIASRPDTALYLDATIILGADWTPEPAARAADPEGWRARIGRWFGRDP
jgi:hypothetical protein